MITKDQKLAIIAEFGANAEDTGSTQVQIALMNQRIRELNVHLQQFPKDFHSRRGLLNIVGMRKRYLNYLKKTNSALYQQLSSKLEV